MIEGNVFPYIVAYPNSFPSITVIILFVLFGQVFIDFLRVCVGEG